MAQRTPIKRQVIEEPEEELEEEAEVEAEEETDLADDSEAEEDEVEEVEQPKPAPRVARRVVEAPAAKVAPKPAAKPAPVAAPKPGVVTRKVVVPPPAAKPAAAPKVAPKAAKPVAEEEAEAVAPAAPAKIKPVSTVVAENVFTQLMEAMTDGQTVMITRNGDKWSLNVASGKEAAKVAGKKKLSGAEFDLEVLTPEYLQWQEEWKAKTFEEKKAWAKKQGVQWTAYEDPRIEVIHLSKAVQEHLGLEKYKPEYRTLKARAAVKG